LTRARTRAVANGSNVPKTDAFATPTAAFADAG
jgi:hypothetical protein